MAKVAKLITVSLIVRVIVDDNDSDENIFDKALPALKSSLYSNSLSNVEDIKDDTECPYGAFDNEE